MSIYPELEHLPPEELIAAFEAGPGSAAGLSADEHDLWLDEVACKIAAHGERGLDFLLRRLGTADEARLRALLLGFSFADPEALRKRGGEVQGQLRAFLLDHRPGIVAGAVDTLSHLGDGEAAERVVPLLRHPSPFVVGSALRFLSRHRPDMARPLLRQALESPEWVIRENAVDELDELNDREALPQLRRLLSDEHEHVRQAARSAVEHLEAESKLQGS
jgi:HEAT repeat protein